MQDPLEVAGGPSAGSASQDEVRKPSGDFGRSAAYAARLAKYQEAISGPIIDFKAVRELAFQGVPDASNMRSVYWKLLLNYLPLQTDKWEETLERKRALYAQFRRELIVDPHEEPAHEDHPLSLDRGSKWNAYFADQQMLVQIDKDVRRTHPDYHFFYMTGDELTPHHHAIMRVLFIYAKLNPGIKYVQGMNELLAPIYYVYASDTTPMFKGHEEADAFFCFTAVMAEVRDHFCQSLDKTTEGITATLNRLMRMVREHDRVLADSIERKGIHPQFFALRWITLFLSQEFSLPDTLRLWDSLFSDPQRFDFLLFFCTAMVLNIRDQLLEGDFADNVKILQSYPPTDFYTLFNLACNVRRTAQAGFLQRE